jgi:hypothetical protein
MNASLSLAVLSDTIVKGKPINWVGVRAAALAAERDWAQGAPMPEGSAPILTAPTGNLKMTKGDGLPVYSLSLAPANLSGYEVCPWRTADCTRGCIGHKAGNARFPSTMLGRVNRTIELAENPYRFFRRLLRDLSNARKRGPFAYRDNAFSDIPWGSILPTLHAFADRNYNYTKSVEMAFNSLKNRHDTEMVGVNGDRLLHLTLSFTGDNLKQCLDYLSVGGNIAVIVAKRKTDPIPATIWGFPTVDGDANDRRYMDPAGHIAVLTPKAGLDRTRKWVVHPSETGQDAAATRAASLRD